MVGTDNNIAENAFDGSGRRPENWMFAGSDSGRNMWQVLYHPADRYMPSEQCGARKVAALRHIEHICDWPGKPARDSVPES